MQVGGHRSPQYSASSDVHQVLLLTFSHAMSRIISLSLCHYIFFTRNFACCCNVLHTSSPHNMLFFSCFLAINFCYASIPVWVMNSTVRLRSSPVPTACCLGLILKATFPVSGQQGWGNLVGCVPVSALVLHSCRRRSLWDPFDEGVLLVCSAPFWVWRSWSVHFY